MRFAAGGEEEGGMEECEGSGGALGSHRCACCSQRDAAIGAKQGRDGG